MQYANSNAFNLKFILMRYILMVSLHCEDNSFYTQGCVFEIQLIFYQMFLSQECKFTTIRTSYIYIYEPVSVLYMYAYLVSRATEFIPRSWSRSENFVTEPVYRCYQRDPNNIKPYQKSLLSRPYTHELISICSEYVGTTY